MEFCLFNLIDLHYCVALLCAKVLVLLYPVCTFPAIDIILRSVLQGSGMLILVKCFMM